MDFTFNEEQRAVRDAASGVFAGMVTPARVAEVEAGDERIDRELWSALAASDLLGLAVPERSGGAGLGLLELCLVLEAQGAVVAPLPLWAALVAAALPIARFGDPERWSPLLSAVARGEIVLSAALSDVTAGSSTRPRIAARPDGDGWRLNGVAHAVPSAHIAQGVLVPARTAGGEIILVVVDPHAEGVEAERTVTTNREIHPHLQFDEHVVPARDVLVGAEGGAEALEWVVGVAATGLCALQVGICEAALRQTAAHLNEREQFGKPLSSFQGTMLRAADAAIDIEAMRVTLWEAAWRLDSGLDAREAVAVAKWQAAERGQGVVHATQHLHGGTGADISYPIHRYFLWGKQLELQLGGPSVQLARLGTLIAERAAAGGQR